MHRTARRRLVRTLQMEPTAGGGAFLVDTAGNFLLQASRYVLEAMPGSDQMFARPPDEGPTAIYRRLAPDGTVLGSVTYPDRTQLWIRQGMHLWGVELGDFDERYVVRYRIVPEGGG